MMLWSWLVFSICRSFARGCYALFVFAEGMSRKPYPTDVSDEEWAFVAPYLTLMTEDAPQREHSQKRSIQWVAVRGAGG